MYIPRSDRTGLLDIIIFRRILLDPFRVTTLNNNNKLVTTNNNKKLWH